MRRLIIRPGAIGDCILALPAMERLVTAYTEVWVPTDFVPLIQFADKVSSILGTGVNLVGLGEIAGPANTRARMEAFDSIVSWYGTSNDEFRTAMLSMNPACVFHVALPPEDYPGHATDFFAQQVGAPLGLIPRLHVGPQPARDTIVIHPFSCGKKKNWPLASYRDLAKRLPYRVDWLAGPEQDLPEANRFENLSDLAAYIAGAQLYIGNDSGITHIAAAVGVKTVAIFGPTLPERWGPRGPNVEVIRARPLESLSAETVAEAANRLLDLL